MKSILRLICLAIVCIQCDSNKQVVENNETIVLENNESIPTNIILLIGDGMGVSQITGGMYAQNNWTALENFPYVGLQKTHASDDLISDSAASATAMSSGYKTYNGAIGVDVDGKTVKTILEEAEERELCTGLIASSTIVHATPASFIAHNINRANYEEIAEDFLSTEIDLFIGGGKNYFDRRSDNRNLLEELDPSYYVSHFLREHIKDIDFDINKNYAYLSSAYDPLPVSQGRDYLIPASEKAIEYLDKKSQKGFFLMIEGSQIDWGGHAEDGDYVLTEFLEFDKIIQIAYDFAKEDGNTLIIVTGDHETGGYAIQSGSEMGNIISGFTGTYHTGTMVPVFAFGPKAELFTGIYDNTEIYYKMRKALNWQ